MITLRPALKVSNYYFGDEQRVLNRLSSVAKNT